jgi:hypothetical protein
MSKDSVSAKMLWVLATLRNSGDMFRVSFVHLKGTVSRVKFFDHWVSNKDLFNKIAFEPHGQMIFVNFQKSLVPECGLTYKNNQAV